MRVLITGASRGIGLELTSQYAAAGHHVLATCREPAAATELRALAGGCPAIEVAELDVSDDDDIARIGKYLDGVTLDLLVHNAVDFGDSSGDLGTAGRAEWLRMFDVNTIGPLLLTEALRPALAGGDNPRIVGISSVKASIARNAMGASYPYRASKAALNAVLRSLAIDLAPDGIGVYALSPGWVDRGAPVGGNLDYTERLRRARLFRAEFGDFSVRQALEPAVRRMIAVIDHLRPEDSGTFFDHRGQALPW